MKTNTQTGLDAKAGLKGPAEFRGVLNLFRDRVEQWGEGAFVYERAETWRPVSWLHAREYAERFAAAMLELGFQPGDGAAILAGNIKEWPLTDLGILHAGGITVGMYPTSAPAQCEYMLNLSRSSFVLVDTGVQLEKILSVRSRLSRLKGIIVTDPETNSDSKQGIWNLRDFILLGRDALARHRDAIEDRVRREEPEDVITYVFTSGTTGDPKAAMLSNRYFLYNADSVQEIFHFEPGERVLSFLPYCHVGERIFGFAVSLAAGRETYMLPDFNDLFSAIHEVNPHVFGGVPRIYEKMHEMVANHIRALPTAEQEAVEQARRTARNYHESMMNGHAPDAELKARYEQADEQYLRGLREIILGNSMRVRTSGAASLSGHIARDFMSIGAPIYEAYGLTENICVAFNRPGKQRVGTVGIAMPRCEVRLAEDGEILIGGPMRFSGYFQNETATRDMFTADGKWMRSGDIGKFDEDGFLSIVDRKKELIITSTGKNIAPSKIENLVKDNAAVSQCMLVGDGKSYITALITLNPAEAGRIAREDSGLNDILNKYRAGFMDAADFMARLAGSRTVTDYVSATIDEVNKTLNRTEQIKKFKILPFDFSMERNEVTPTLKLKRRTIMERYQDYVKELYS